MSRRSAVLQHDLRTPLSVIALASDTLLERGLSERDQFLVRCIREQAAALGRIIDERVGGSQGDPDPTQSRS